MRFCSGRLGWGTRRSRDGWRGPAIALDDGRSAGMRTAHLIIAFIAGFSAGGPNAGAQSASCPYDLSAIAPAVEQFLAEHPKVPGINVRLQRGTVVLYERSFGAYTPSTAVPIASASKWLSAAVIMSLVDDGIIGLDDPLAMHLPAFAEPPLNQITIRQCYSHTSGLPGYSDCNACLADGSTTLQQCAADIAAGGLTAAPGRAFCYGGCSMQAAAAAAEVAAGTPWNTLFAERVRIPLLLRDTSFGEGDNPRVAGGAVSSARDYAAFLQMQIQGGTFRGRRVLSVLGVEEMQKRQAGDFPAACQPGLSTAFAGYAIGNWVNALGEAGRSLQNSSEGAFAFSPWIDHSRRIAGVFAVVSTNFAARPLIDFVQAEARRAVDTSPDVDGNGLVGFGDVSRVLANWGRTSTPGDLFGPGPIGDTDADGAVAFGDVTEVLSAWGSACIGPQAGR